MLTKSFLVYIVYTVTAIFFAVCLIVFGVKARNYNLESPDIRVHKELYHIGCFMVGSGYLFTEILYTVYIIIVYNFEESKASKAALKIIACCIPIFGCVAGFFGIFFIAMNVPHLCENNVRPCVDHSYMYTIPVISLILSGILFLSSIVVPCLLCLTDAEKSWRRNVRYGSRHSQVAPSQHTQIGERECQELNVQGTEFIHTQIEHKKENELKRHIRQNHCQNRSRATRIHHILSVSEVVDSDFVEWVKKKEKVDI